MKAMLMVALSVCLTSGTAAQPAEKSWLDRPLMNWNDPATPVPKGMSTGETIAELAKRCSLVVNRDTPGQRALADSGWLPYHHGDRQIVQRDVEIVGGMAEADGMCRPMEFNIFIFVGGQPAGTLSPLLMMSRVDGSIGAVRLGPDDTIAADFARYQDRDALCCPSSRVTVRYRIDRTKPQAIVVPVSVQVTRP
jgi:LppP/LprE lipoprotein